MESLKFRLLNEIRMLEGKVHIRYDEAEPMSEEESFYHSLEDFLGYLALYIEERS